MAVPHSIRRLLIQITATARCSRCSEAAGPSSETPPITRAFPKARYSRYDKVAAQLLPWLLFLPGPRALDRLRTAAAIYLAPRAAARSATERCSRYSEAAAPLPQSLLPL